MTSEYAYIRMALGLPIDYTTDAAEMDMQSENPAKVDYVWTDSNLADEICEKWGITRRKFVMSMAAPRPSTIQHLIFNAELVRMGLEPLGEWPKSQGLIIPRRENGRIVRLEFKRLSEILKGRPMEKAAST